MCKAPISSLGEFRIAVPTDVFGMGAIKNESCAK